MLFRSDDATEHLKKHGLLLGDMSRVTGRLNFSFKDYIAVFRDVFREQSAQMDFAGDFDIMKAAVIKALNQLDENKIHFLLDEHHNRTFYIIQKSNQ